MNFHDYIEASARTDLTDQLYKAQALLLAEDPLEMAFLHHAIGLATEVVEYMGAVMSPDHENHVIEEVGDMWWYFAGLWRTTDRMFPNNSLHGSWARESKDVLFCSAEILDMAKRLVFYGKSPEFDKLLYLLRCCNVALCDLADPGLCREKNIEKLMCRHPDGFDKDRAVNRDVDRERGVF